MPLGANHAAGQTITAADMNTLESTVNAKLDTTVASGTYQLKTEGATLVELVASGVLLGGAAVAGTDSYPFFVAPFPLKITQVSLCTKNAIAASDTNYWEVRLRKSNAGGATTIASKFTKVTGGSAVVGNVDWNFDAITFDPTNQTFAKGDMFNVAFFLTGSAAGINWSYVACTLRYEPV